MFKRPRIRIGILQLGWKKQKGCSIPAACMISAVALRIVSLFGYGKGNARRRRKDWDSQNLMWIIIIETIEIETGEIS